MSIFIKLWIYIMGSILGFMFWEGWAWAGETAVVVDPSKAAHLANHLSVEFIVQLYNVQCTEYFQV